MVDVSRVEEVFRRAMLDEERLEAALRQLELEIELTRQRLEDTRTLRDAAEMLFQASGEAPQAEVSSSRVLVDDSALPADKAAALAELDELDELDGVDESTAVPSAAVASAPTRTGVGKRRLVTAPAAPTAPARLPAKGKSAKKVGSSRADSRYENLSIVDAAIAMARDRKMRTVSAGDVESWFEEAGYTTRGRMPSRNSIYVSLNREHTEGEKRGSWRVQRIARGTFRFMGVSPDEPEE